MNKRALIKKIIARLTDELAVYFRAANASRAEATHEQNKAEDKYDTRGLEASYLARGQSRQAAEIESAIAEFEKLAVRKFGDGEAIDPGALVELETGGERSFYFIGPRAGGTEVVHEKRKSSSSRRNRHWANSSWAGNKATSRNSTSAARNRRRESSAWNRAGTSDVCPRLEFRRDEFVAGDPAHGGQHARIGDATPGT
jgi:hypothetical protein